MQQSAVECRRVPQSAAECRRVPQSAAKCSRVQQSAAEWTKLAQSNCKLSGLVMGADVGGGADQDWFLMPLLRLMQGRIFLQKQLSS